MKLQEIRIRDPFLYSEGGVDYLIGTTASDALGGVPPLTAYFSRDGENFERLGALVTDGSLATYRDIWAPEMHRYRDRYYLIVSVNRDDLGRGSIIFVSDTPAGSYRMLTGQYITPVGWGCLDATLFVYGGRPYLCFSNEWTTPITGDGDGALYMAELTENLTEIVGRPHKIISGKYTSFTVPIEVNVGGTLCRGYVAEGPWLYEENGAIVLLWSCFTKDGYAVVRSISRNGIFGDYEFDRMVFTRDGGHCMRFTDRRGTPCLILHRPNTPPDERPCILPDSASGAVE